MSEKIDIYETKNPLRLYPLLATRGLVVMPDIKVSFDVGRKSSIKAIETAMHNKYACPVLSEGYFGG